MPYVDAVKTRRAEGASATVIAVGCLSIAGTLKLWLRDLATLTACDRPKSCEPGLNEHLALHQAYRQ